MKRQPLGKQYLVEFYNCNKELLNNTEKIRLIMEQAADTIGATIIDSKFHRFTPHGVSGMVLIAESHLAIHTWPEYGYAAFDLFTCSSKIDAVTCFQDVELKLEAKIKKITKLDRGCIPLSTGKNSCA